MAEIIQKTWRSGWRPGDDEMNRDPVTPYSADPNGLLRMDNLFLDDDGAVTLCRGSGLVSTGAAVINIYSKVIAGAKQRYRAHSTGTITRGLDGTGTTVISGGVNHAAFGNGFGQVFVASGSKTAKDDGTTIRNWGIAAPVNQVVIGVQQTPVLDVSGVYANYTLIEGATLVLGADYVQSNLDATTLRSICQLLQAIDTTAFAGGGVAQDTDGFKVSVRIGDASTILKTRVEFLLTTPSGATNDVSDYFYFEWPNRDTTSYRGGINSWTTLQCNRGDFIRIGTKTDTLTWANVVGIRVIFEGTVVHANVFQGLNFQGGSKGLLEAGTEKIPIPYDVVQINVYNSGAYLGKSGPGPSNQYAINKSTANYHPDIAGIDSQVNECWFFRRGGTLPDYYFVGKCAPGGTFLDTVSDEQALLVGLVLNQFLVPFNGIGDEIQGIEGPINGKMIAMTYRALYISDLFNPDSFDSRKVLLTAFNVGEVNQFVAKISDNFIVLGTTADIYELSGTWADLPDGTLDVTVRPLGVKQPPIAHGFAIDSNILFYMANDGIRELRGGTSGLVTGDNFRHLFKGIARYGVPGILMGFAESVSYRFASNQGKLYFTAYHTDATQSLFVYDFFKKYWYRWNTNAGSLFTEEDGTLLGGYGTGELVILDTGTQLKGNQLQTINLRTTLYDGKMPYQRKDLFVLKLNIDTGGSSVDVLIGDESTNPVLLGTISSNGLTEQFLLLNGTNHNLHKRFSLQITDHVGAGVLYFRLLDFSIDFDPRPIPLPFLRIAPDQYGVAGRKRIDEIPFVIDTLGHDVTVTPIIDNVAGSTQLVNTSNKSRVSYYFTTQTYGTDIGYLLTAGGGFLFEFYETLKPKMGEILPDPVKFYRIPSTNKGSTNRKRIYSYDFLIDTKGNNVTFTPFVDGVSYPTMVVNTSEKTSVTYYFMAEVLGTDIWGTLDGGANVFEFYGLDEEESKTTLEILPDAARFHRIPFSNLGSISRKRIYSYAFIIDTRGFDVIFTPIVDGVSSPTAIVNTNGKTTFVYEFVAETIGIDIGGTLSGAHSFEYYELDQRQTQTTFEVLPDADRFYRIPVNNLGTAVRKRILCLAFVIDTKGSNVTFTPIVDGVAATTLVVNTTGKTTVLYTFANETIGVDISGTFVGLAIFEYYGINLEECIIEKMPPRGTHYVVPNENFGTAAQKRIRVIPMVINTFGHNVTFTPVVDNVAIGAEATVFNTPSKQTVFMLFQTDQFGVDYGGILDGANVFEFYGFQRPERVETLPPPKLFDQVGPLTLDRSGKLLEIRPRFVALANINYNIFMNDGSKVTGTIVVTPNVDKRYTVKMPQSIIGNVFRAEFSSTQRFNRWDCICRFDLAGAQSDNKVVTLR